MHCIHGILRSIALHWKCQYLERIKAASTFLYFYLNNWIFSSSSGNSPRGMINLQFLSLTFFSAVTVRCWSLCVKMDNDFIMSYIIYLLSSDCFSWIQNLLAIFLVSKIYWPVFFEPAFHKIITCLSYCARTAQRRTQHGPEKKKQYISYIDTFLFYIWHRYIWHTIECKICIIISLHRLYHVRWCSVA